MGEIILYDYWRSSASYRVRIALNSKGLDYSTKSIDLLTAQHKASEHLIKQPQGLVPAIDIDGKTISQSLAIIEYLDETRPKTPLLPEDAIGRARVRALSYAIAMEIHPVCNLSVVKHVEHLAGGGDETKIKWMQKYIHAGLAAFEDCLEQTPGEAFCYGDHVSMADCCLIPQLYNATRWGIDYCGFEKICGIEKACATLPAFIKAHPDNCKPE